MKILYGVQGTGNGHLSRARAMATAFKNSALSVDYLFSGRDPARYFAMECFGAYLVRPGLTFVNRGGRVNYLRTVLANRYGRFMRDVLALDLSAYDLVLSDFEPITAWAGRLRGKPVVSLGHQPAFDHAVPVASRNLRTQLVMRLFAPGDLRVGMHWDSFGAPILPPLIGHGLEARPCVPRKVVVYLPFEDQARVQSLLATLPEYEFFVYAPGSRHERRGHMHLRPTCLDGFRRDLEDSVAVVCNAGFELASECLALGKRLLVKPQGQQMEQASNALALEQLGYGQAMHRLDAGRIRDWLAQEGAAPKLGFPDVAAALVAWFESGDLSPRALQALSERLWRAVRVERPATGELCVRTTPPGVASPLAVFGA